MRFLFVCLFVTFMGSGAQSQIEYEILAPLPEAVSNNAVTSIQVNGKWYVYSFAGIDTSKEYSGIHSKVFCYDVDANTWSQLEDLPGDQARIAAGASTIKDKIYILGGYEVFSNGTEVSINSLHVFDPLTNSFLEDAMPIPKAIDDQVQFVYKDSLLYSVTGWSDVANVVDVWIYDAMNNSWQKGTDIPSSAPNRAFGASGTVVGDTIYFIGGAISLGNFPASDRLRKGYVNPLDPTDISWSTKVEENGIAYRSGASSVFSKPFWLGGSLRTYNYNGIAYSDNTAVNATNRIVFYNPESGILSEQTYDFPEIMDLRGLAKIGDNTFISVGGMKENQEVTDRVVKYTIEDLVHVSSHSQSLVRIYPNPTSDFIHVTAKDERLNLKIYDSVGRLITELKNISNERIDVSMYQKGLYFLKVSGKNKNQIEKIVIN